MHYDGHSVTSLNEWKTEWAVRTDSDWSAVRPNPEQKGERYSRREKHIINLYQFVYVYKKSYWDSTWKHIKNIGQFWENWSVFHVKSFLHSLLFILLAYCNFWHTDPVYVFILKFITNSIFFGMITFVSFKISYI